MRLLRLFGAEMTYSPSGWNQPAAGGVAQKNVSFSGLLYFIPTFPVGAYLKAGVEGSSYHKLWQAGLGNTYHVGGGLDFQISQHMIFGAELLMLRNVPAPAPGVDTSFGGSLQHFSMDSYRVSWSLMYYL